MAEIKRIEVVCMQCHKCDVVREKIRNVMNAIGNKNNMRMRYEFIFCADRKEAMAKIRSSGYDLNQLPVTLINGQLAFSGSRITEQEIRIIVEGILKY